MFDASLSLGWKLQDSKKAQTTLQAGYAINRQYLDMTNYVQTIDTSPNPQLGPFPSVSASYKALWRGPVQIRLNEVRWDSWMFRLKATYRF